MEAFILYSLKSGLLLLFFWGTYHLFLRKETFYGFNRLFLLFGLITAALLPLLKVRYPVVLEAPLIANIPTLSAQAIHEATTDTPSFLSTILLCLYLGGTALLFISRFVGFLQLQRVIRKQGYRPYQKYNLIESADFAAPFSFFRYIFLPEKIADEREKDIILCHEKAHLDQYHWIDLILLGSMKWVSWFNPVIWIYEKAVRENHEFLADSAALHHFPRTDYLSTLATHWIKMPAFSTTNSFTYSNPLQRITMMKKEHSSPGRRLPALLMVPVIALFLIFCAEPEYALANPDVDRLAVEDKGASQKISGKITDQKGEAIFMASVIIRSRNIGTLSDEQGNFSLDVIPGDTVVIHQIGYQPQTIIPQKSNQPFNIQLNTN
ncbi:carboxypeptidase-like regulatory domain-containing protein [Parabacteroides sp. OttesenSCG-928-G06]|nr:carboxypeptidase-like regulatory domain-containing protein [Parabacteroides sp. OttesenSCG-928-G06]